MTILLFLAVLFVLVLVHEWGHFVVAKRFGMRVDEFGIGFPPKLWGFKKGETEYTLNAVPLGGFVKIYGEDADASTASEDPDRDRAFTRRPVYAQAAVLVAGVTMNVLLAWVLFSVAFSLGIKEVVTEETASDSAELVVLSVLPNSPAAEMGLQPGDQILKVVNENGHPVDSLKPTAVSEFIQDYDSLTVTYVQAGEEVTQQVATARNLAPNAPERRVIGITMGLVEEVERPITTAIYDAGKHTIEGIGAITVGIISLLKDAFLLQADLSGVAGPVGIAGLVGDAAAFGLASLLMFTAVISLNLAVINLLPFPALDGGRLIISFIEGVKGSPIPPRVTQIVNAAGFILLMLLMVAVTYNDIVRLF